jgi:hypothetical protein
VVHFCFVFKYLFKNIIMKDNSTKEKLFEMLVKLNPELVTLNEIVGATTAPVVGTQAPTTGTPVGKAAPAATAQPQKPLATDVQSLNKATQTATGIQNKMSRINTATEFPQAFKLWFAGLGYKPENPAISTSRVLTDIRKAMAEMGYK